MSASSANISKFIAHLAKQKDVARRAAVRALNVFAERVIGDAQQLTPVDTGALQASGTTLPATESGDHVEKVIGFNTSYAAAVHERLDARHGAELAAQKKKPKRKKRRPKGGVEVEMRAWERRQFKRAFGIGKKKRKGKSNPLGQAKFLETAVRENAPKFAPFLAARVRAAVGAAKGGQG